MSFNLDVPDRRQVFTDAQIQFLKSVTAEFIKGAALKWQKKHLRARYYHEYPWEAENLPDWQPGGSLTAEQLAAKQAYMSIRDQVWSFIGEDWH